MTKAECVLNAIQRECKIDHGGFELFAEEIRGVRAERAGRKRVTR